jgi:thiamine pyrophosphokinase
MNSELDQKTVVIVANGEGISPERLKRIIKTRDVIIAADGGARHCRDAGLTPHFIIGDLDSLSQDLRDHFSHVSLRHIPDQDSTDMEKALQFARGLNPQCIKVIAVFGLRIDHTLANLLVFHEFPAGISLQIYDASGMMRLLTPGEHRLEGKPGQMISLFAVQPVRGLTLDGFRYPLLNQNYASTFIGLSNVCEEALCTIRFLSGKLFLYILETGT